VDPGQDLEAIFDRIPYDAIKSILGEDVCKTVSYVVKSESAIAQLRKLATHAVYTRPEEYFSQASVRALIHESLSATKVSELCGRIGIKRDDLGAFDPSDDPRHWDRYLGFFGIDARQAAPFHAELPLEPVAANFGLFAHQRKAAQRVMRKLEDPHGRVILHMPTGAGKTRTAIHLVSRFLTAEEPAVVVWLAGTSELLDQAADAFTAAWPYLGNRETSVARFWGDYDADLSEFNDGLVIAGFQKMYAWSTRDSLGLLRFSAKTKLVVVDEAHQSIAPTYAALIDRLADSGSRHNLLGLTATPGRTWADIAKDEELADFFDGNKVMLQIEGWEDPVSYLMAEGYLAKPRFHKITYEPSDEVSDFFQTQPPTSDTLDETAADLLAADASRNSALIDEVRRLIDKGHTRIILFAASVRHAEIMSAALFCQGIDAPVVTGTTNKSRRRKFIKDFRSSSNSPSVLCNFGVLTTGFDAPNTSAAVIARPTKSLVLYSQMVGRATRGVKAGGNESCDISTVVDVDLPGFGDMAEAFKNWEDVWDE
jgi:DNA repair protein RadD